MTFWPLFETYPLWCVPQAVWFNRIDDPTKPFLSFLNVRYFLIPDSIDPPPGWPTIAEDLTLRLVENPSVLPRAFAPAEFQVTHGGQEELQLMEGIQDFRRLGVVERLVGQPTGVWISNGNASVRILSYAPQKLSIGITARQPTLVATSVTAWPGWRLEVDGVRSALLHYNHAFLSFAIPAGNHRAELRYMPLGFVLGAGVTSATLTGLCVGGLIRRRRRETRLNPAESTPS